MNNPIKKVEWGVDRPFMWRAAGGELVLPADLPTRRLFFIVRMIWNHTMPASARTHDYQEHTFGEFYTEAYMKQAISVIIPMLLKRHDLEDVYKVQLNGMIDWLATHQIAKAKPYRKKLK